MYSKTKGQILHVSAPMAALFFLAKCHEDGTDVIDEVLPLVILEQQAAATFVKMYIILTGLIQGLSLDSNKCLIVSIPSTVQNVYITNSHKHVTFLLK